MIKSPSQLVVVSGVSFVVWLTILVGGVVFVASGLARAMSQYASLRLQINQFEEKNTKYEQSLASYQNVSANTDRINNSFVKGDAILSLLMQLENEAKNTNNTYSVAVTQDVSAPVKRTKETTATTGAKAATPIIPGTVLTISLTGTFANIFQFVHDVERLPYFIQVQHLTIRNAATTHGASAAPTVAVPSQLQALFVIKVFSPAL